MAITTNNLISRQTVGSAGAATITFSNIPQTFTDLRIVVSARLNLSTQSLGMYFNTRAQDSSWRTVQGENASGAASASGSAKYDIYIGDANYTASTASTFSTHEIYIPNYTSSNQKSASVDAAQEWNSANGPWKFLIAGLSTKTAAITSITIDPYEGASDTFVEFTTVSLYGISSSTSTQNTSIPSATGGDVITTDGTYWYHAFKYSGTFTPLKALTADYLVVAGGGGGAGSTQNGAGMGGGGAGGLRSTVTATGGSGSLESVLSLTPQNYTVTIGAGGAAGPGNDSFGTTGSNSVFGSITSNGGGGGAAYTAGLGGGSGGGGSYTGVGGAASPSGQGYAGGNGSTYNASTYYPGGGGGGAGAVGGNGSTTSTVGGNGGVGRQLTAFSTATVTGASGYYAGGGGGSVLGNGTTGGTGGSGGGGSAGSATATVGVTGGAGTANTGGGGAGGAPAPTGNSSGSAPGGAGGSGIVIVRYTV